MIPSSEHAALTIANCLKEHRLYDHLKTFRAAGGARKPRSKLAAVREAVEAVEPMKPEPVVEPSPKLVVTPKPIGRRPNSNLKLYQAGKIIDVGSFAILRRSYRHQIVGPSFESFKRYGYHLFQDGAVVWDATREHPRVIDELIRRSEGGLLKRAEGLRKREA